MNSFYGGLNVAALDPEYLASFYMPVFVLEQLDNGETVLTIKNYHKDFRSHLENDGNTLDIETAGVGL